MTAGTALAGTVVLALVPGFSACYRAVDNYRDSPGPRFIGAATAAPDSVFGAAIKVVSWNVKWGDAPEAAAHVLATNPLLRGADLVVLQEMHETAVATIAARLGAGYVYYPATLHPRVGHHVGNAILSRWPLLEDRKLVLPRVSLLMRTGRAAVVATALVRGRRIRVYSLHLATPFEIGQTGIEDQLRAVIRDAEGSPDPVVIAGDFNSSTLGGLLVAERFHWVTQHVGPSAWVVSLDHIFVRDLHVAAVEAGVVKEGDLPSDHRPVWAMIQLQRP
jgi:endonuclease/exonuclease/phosphatase family metal-dependent hydrolase